MVVRPGGDPEGKLRLGSKGIGRVVGRGRLGDAALILHTGGIATTVTHIGADQA